MVYSVGRSRPKRRCGAVLLVSLFVAGLMALFGSPAVVFGQTTTTGSIQGVVLGEGGESLDGVRVTIFLPSGEEGLSQVASRDGSFRFAFLSPGRYDILMERLGFVPLHVAGVTVVPGASARLHGTLRAAPPPVQEVERLLYSEVGGESGAFTGRSRSGEELRGLPLRGNEFGSITGLLPASGQEAGFRGLPMRYIGLTLDGIPFRGVSHPAEGRGIFHLSAITAGSLNELRETPLNPDAEWRSTEFSAIRATSRRGLNQREMSLQVGGVLGPLELDDGQGGVFEQEQAPELRLYLAGPIVRDTAHYSVGLEARRVTRTRRSIAFSQEEEAARFVQLLAETGGLGAMPTGPLEQGEFDHVSSHARVDWMVSEGHELSFAARAGILRNGPWDLEPLVARRGTMEGTDLMTSASLFSRLSEGSALEVRTGFEQGTREFSRGTESLARTLVLDGGLMAGSDPWTTGEFRRSSFSIAPALHLHTDQHRLKLGVQGGLDRHTALFREGEASVFLFPTLDALEERTGAHLRFDGPRPDRTFQTGWASVFVQDMWSPTETLTLTGGFRVDFSSLPLDDIVGSGTWALLSGVDPAEVEEASPTVNPRLSVEWRPRQEARWRVQGAWGIERARVDPALLMEVVQDSGMVLVRREAGLVSGWPTTASPDSVFGRRLSLLGPRFEAPRTQSVGINLSGPVAPGLEIEVGVEHRSLSFLPRVRDLNRVPRRFAVDQFGRELFGEIIEADGVLTTRPGSDRRFGGFDVVRAFESDGSGSWSGLHGTLRYLRPEGLSLSATYEFSVSEDDAPFTAGGLPTLASGRRTSAGGDPDWLNGTSDLDRPHRLVVSGRVPLPGPLDVSLGAFYSLTSGVPFTPSVRDGLGVEALEPWAASQPIAIPSGVASQITDVLGEWPCLQAAVSGRRLRNECRGEALQDLNLQVRVGLGSASGLRVDLTLEALDLLESSATIPDPALFVLDPSGALELVPGSDEVRLPVRVNPGFGRPFLESPFGRSLRLGLGLRF